jgi:hypothetical protein
MFVAGAIAVFVSVFFRLAALRLFSTRLCWTGVPLHAVVLNSEETAFIEYRFVSLRTHVSYGIGSAGLTHTVLVPFLGVLAS